MWYKAGTPGSYEDDRRSTGATPQHGYSQVCVALIEMSKPVSVSVCLFFGATCPVVCAFVQNISTPIITAKLVQDDSKTSARVVKAKIEKTTLGQVGKRLPRWFSAVLGSGTWLRHIKMEVDIDFSVCSMSEWLD